MTSLSEPLVSVVTPVYNGEKYLEQCIESVLAQSYGNLDYVIVNNCSTDDSLGIARRYARKDSRLRIHNNSEFLPHVRNWNHALRQISAISRYCKVVHADDWLYPECVARMVDLAEKHPTVGIVGAYRVVGDRYEPRHPPTSTVTSGRQICRDYLLTGRGVFGSPTSLLILSDLIRSRAAFYNESNLHADPEACLDVLQDSDFGFVPRVLTYTRLHDKSVTSGHQSLETMRLLRYHLLRRYGRVYLSDQEYRERLSHTTSAYYRFLWKTILRSRSQVWPYHQNGLRGLGYNVSLVKLTQVLLLLVVNGISHPKRNLRILLRSKV